MRLEEEARQEEEKLVGNVRHIPELTMLEETLRQSLPAFEKALCMLPSEEREIARRTYLNKIRKLTFGFHLALVRQKARKDYSGNPTPEEMGTILGRSAAEMQRIGRLYRFI
jgi:hypothetical protein